MLLEILEGRGYNTSEYSGFSVTEVHSLMRNNQLDLLLTKQSDGKVNKDKSGNTTTFIFIFMIISYLHLHLHHHLNFMDI